MERLFGTDGVRGVANKYLTPQLAFGLGEAACEVFKADGEEHPLFVIGTDTRISCDMLSASLSSGIMSRGGIVCDLGVIPTPAISVLTREMNARAGVVISASHNPFYDNGIKFFNALGMKLDDEIEDKIQFTMGLKENYGECTHALLGHLRGEIDAEGIYISYLLKKLPEIDLRGLKIVLDCANGASYRIAPLLFKKTGAEIVAVASEPDGININEKCGSTHPEALMKKVLEERADYGLAFDGDADRLIAIDEKGTEVNGDKLMYMFAKYLKNKNALKNNTVVVTVMSNMGLKLALKNEGISVDETPVGDRYIIQSMNTNGFNLGGEQSGHIILSDFNVTGDGLCAALLLSHILKESGKTLSESVSVCKDYPQILLNVKTAPENKTKYKESDKVRAAVEELNKKYNGGGRILLRHSGTEALVRIMIEGKDKNEIEKDAKYLAGIIDEISK